MNFIYSKDIFTQESFNLYEFKLQNYYCHKTFFLDSCGFIICASEKFVRTEYARFIL